MSEWLRGRRGCRAGMALGVATLLACGSVRTAPARAYQDGDRTQQGIEHYNAGRYAEAETALRGAPGAEAKSYLAASIAKQGTAAQSADRKAERYREAEGLAVEALEALPTQAVAAQALGEALVGLERHDDAIARLSAVLAAKNDVAYAYYWRGKAYNAKHQTARMVDDFQAFLRLAPDAPEAAAVRALLAALS